jgi:hypothetical protein
MMADAGDCPPMTPRAVEIVVGDPPERWSALGFTVAAGAISLGGVRIRTVGGAPGIRSLGLAGCRAEHPDGLPLVRAGGGTPAMPEHANGALAVDHVVALTDDLDRTTRALEAAGLPLRRVRRPPESPVAQAFLPAGTLVVEVAETGDAPALWGLVVVVADLDAAATRLGAALGAPRDAVQPGRRIATVRRSAGLSTQLALMTPRRTAQQSAPS